MLSRVKIGSKIIGGFLVVALIAAGHRGYRNL